MGHRKAPPLRLPITVRRCENKEEYQRQWRKLNPDWWLKRYGITREDYDGMLIFQGLGCAICSTQSPKGRHNKFQVDHDHCTNEVRGLLCDKCNRGLGFFNENPDTLEKAANYIRSYSNND